MMQSATTSAETLPAGTLVGDRYIVDAYLARGGFATVYRAHHRDIGRKVAIKVLEPPVGNRDADSFRRRFLQEAQLAARIDHPGVVDVFDFGVLIDERPYLAMDLLEGHDLELELELNGAMDAARLVPLFAECLGALAEAHQLGIVHKDLKPSNLFLVNPGRKRERLVILDFGIARLFDEPDSRMTREGGFSGTPAYLAPEYIREQRISPALDTYQMGLILIELLVGAPAIKAATSMGYLMAHCLHPIELPLALEETPLGRVCLRAVEKKPEDRFANAGEFQRALLELDLRHPLRLPRTPSPTADPNIEGARTLQLISVEPEELAHLRQDYTAPFERTKAVPDEPNLSGNRSLLLILSLVLLSLTMASLLTFALTLRGSGESVTTDTPPAQLAPPAKASEGAAGEPLTAPTEAVDNHPEVTSAALSNTESDLGGLPAATETVTPPPVAVDVETPTTTAEPQPRKAPKSSPRPRPVRKKPSPSPPDEKPMLLAP